MQPIEIFRTGSHTATNGQTLPFDSVALSAAVSAYDPSLHEAPVVVGHPKDNHPAFGWIDHLELKDGVVLAHPKQVDADFAELVKQGKYKKRSASWYLPDSPNNPKPGTLYLRHVGFLGAQPPALKGLKDVRFNEAEKGVVEFADASVSPFVFFNIANLLRKWREKIIAKDGIEEADKLLPTYDIDSFAEEAERLRRERDKPLTATIPVSFTESNTMTPEQIAALQAENAQLKADAAKGQVSFAEQETALKARELALAKREISTQIDALVVSGKVLAAQKAGLIEFMTGLESTTLTVEFGEGDTAKKVSPRQFMLDYLGSMPNLIEFAELSKGGKAVDLSTMTAAEFAEKITAYQTEMSAKGVTVSTSQAAAHITAQA